MPETICLERMTSPQVRQALDRGMKSVVVPCGAVEQHGPHLPLFVDAEHGTHLGRAVAERLGNALLAPTIRTGCSEHHMTFPGTISLERATFEAVCRDYAVSLSRHGFSKICFLPTHGGNFKPLAEMAPGLSRAVGADTTVLVYTDLLGFIEIWRETVERETGLGDRVGGHADIAETSLMLALHPDLVRVDLATHGFSPAPGDGDVVDRIIRDGFSTVTPNGILGDARGATAAVGAHCIAAAADAVAAFFDKESSRA